MIGNVTDTAASAYQRQAERLRLALAQARAADREGDGDLQEVERLTRDLQLLRADARQSGISL